MVSASDKKIQTFAGTRSFAPYDESPTPATSATLFNQFAVAVDISGNANAQGNVYIHSRSRE